MLEKYQKLLVHVVFLVTGKLSTKLFQVYYLIMRIKASLTSRVQSHEKGFGAKRKNIHSASEPTTENIQKSKKKKS